MKKNRLSFPAVVVTIAATSFTTEINKVNSAGKATLRLFLP